VSFRFHRAAQEEFLAAIEWYESRSHGLGGDFASETIRAVRRAESMPEAWPVVAPDLRRVMVHRFPYAVIYSMDGNQLIVFAVMHFRRKPDYWRERLPN
jgi:predicted alpha/beta-fold hydrolase